MTGDVDLVRARRVALATAAVGGVAFVVLAILLVPWHPVPGGAPDPVPATDLLTAEQIDRAEQFSRWSRVWSWSALALSLAVACWLGFSRRARDWAARTPGPWWLRVWLLVLVVTVVGRVVVLPLTVARRQLLLDAGLATSSWGAWTVDLLIGVGVDVVATGIALTLVVACARRFRRWWPALVAGLLAALVALGSFIYPVVIEPLFNDFEPLPQGSLRTAILQIADEEGVAVEDVLVADASRRTSTLNAYVSGFGSTRRVVLYDTLVDDLPEDQTLSVVAHELAHAENDDVLVGTALGAAGVVFGVGLLGALVLAGERRGRWRLADGSAVPAVLALVALASLAAAPVQNGISRLVETRADVVALRVTEDPGAFLAMQQRLAERSLADPTPPAWSQWWFGSHPTLVERAALALD
ncbi:M48 family metalloprotease [Nocardioides sambongensis]|uniref:M48 family metalloprotease n=1 Tax=Nocardioides sambongensis TaxID=2589074 RepID=UPI001E56A56B|nr:M48 family metalloprotease [Nocardioides sambongensis]